jgi:hypothetical protein
MRVTLLIAAALAGALAAVHSVLGERYILIRLFRRTDLPKLFGSTDFTTRTLRLAWHITSVLALGLSAQLVALAGVDSSPKTEVHLISITSALCGVVALVFSKGRHLSWIVFFAIAGFAWRGYL